MSSDQKTLSDTVSDSQNLSQSSKDWEKVKLEEVCNITTGKLNAGDAVEDGDYPFFTCDPETQKIDSYSFDTEAVLLAGNNANGEFNVKYYKGKFDVYQRTYVVTSEDEGKLDNRFLYYALNLKLNFLKSQSVGTATQYLTMTILNDIEIELPPIKIQERIVEILGSLDDKLETNNRINEILEGIAQALFKSWFVDFESYEDFKDSELGEIPEDFEEGELSHLVSLKNGKYIKKDDQSEEGKYPVYGSNGKTERTDKKNLEERCVTVGRVGSIGEIYRVEEEAWVSDNCIIAKPDNQAQYYYLYLLLTQYNFERYNQGSSHPMITQEAIKSRDVAIPPAEDIERFERKVEPLFEDILRRKEQNKELEEMRDTLLPKLMSGEIRVNVDGDE